MREVRRELFLPADQLANSAKDSALPIGCNQTISQPSLVAHMTEQLELDPGSRVLEIGTGSGYQTAILANLAAEVFTIERIAELADSARFRLLTLGYRNIRFRTGDGALGWPEDAPFDGIIVTAAPERIPSALIHQLARGGRLVAPIGSLPLDNQRLVVLKKDQEGGVVQRDLFAVRFVPLISGTISED